MTESALVGALAGSLALPVTWAMLRVAATRLAEQFPIEFVLDVNPDASVFAYVLAISMLAGILFGLLPALASSRAALFSITRGAGTSLARGRLRHVLIAAQVAVSLTLMIAGGLLVRSASQALNMTTGYDAERVVSVSLHFRRPPPTRPTTRLLSCGIFAAGWPHCLASAQSPARERRTTTAEDEPRCH